MGFSPVRYGFENQSRNQASVPGWMSCFFISSAFSMPVMLMLLPEYSHALGELAYLTPANACNLSRSMAYATAPRTTAKRMTIASLRF